MVEDAAVGDGQALVELSQAMVALHRDQFGRGPGAARSFINGGVVICMLSDVYTAAERTLIDVGEAEHVRRTRALHQEALAAEYRASAEKILCRPVTAFLSAVHVDPDVAIEIFLLGERG